MSNSNENNSEAILPSGPVTVSSQDSSNERPTKEKSGRGPQGAPAGLGAPAERVKVKKLCAPRIDLF